ncbi:MAG: regulatory protein RecX [Armatimonadota bacterium]|nr:regulatory protein RecX [Armatimonadota bacterium]MDR7421748.1 regulatory protein RecX [Armatimonadota bacterium]MDR7453370.1 regulatory protein RecX [Armatimonadota bacterium]MDR7457189.1 regulatory protein RecX [Armatimonadota bacterium]MDR7496071.1 regulatory protein RecX [Armatimonadota bacterium]
MSAPAPRILRIQALARRPGVCRVDIAGAGTYPLECATVRALGLAEGAEVSSALLERVRAAAARLGAREAALRLLRRRLRSRVELEAALRRRGAPPDAVLAVVGELRRLGWIDDARFARAWIRDRLALRPCGARRLRAELRRRGVSAQVIAEALAELLPFEMEDDLAVAQARSRLGRLRALSPEAARRRLAGWLARRGYPAEVIARALRHLLPGGGGSTGVGPAA